MATTIQENQAEILRQKLAMAVKSIQWSYAIFWSISSTEPGVLKWCDGYYNGDIKTRKTVQAMEMKDDEEEVGLQRTEQLSQLYESLSAASETHPQARRPSAALSPEDLTDTEWYFLVCMSFEFTNGQGLPGRSLAKNTSIWLCNAHFADSKVFSRSLLAKSASIQTVVCFPYLEGAIEIGITEKVLEDQSIINKIKALILEVQSQDGVEIPNRNLEPCSNMLDHDLVDNNLDTMLECEQTFSAKNSSNGVPEDSFMAGDVNVRGSQVRSWQLMDDDEEGEVSFFQNNSMGSSDCISQNKVNGPKSASFDFRSDDDSHYQGVLSTIFKSTRRLILGPRFRIKESGFVSWKNGAAMGWKKDSSQMLLKKALYEVPKMHKNRSLGSYGEHRNKGRPWKPEADDANNAFLERQENINRRFSVLSSLVPSTGKVDKVSILDDTIEYLKMLERRVEELESDMHVGDREITRTKKMSHDMVERTSDNYKTLTNKRKASCDLEDLQEDGSLGCITVSAVENDVTIEIRCRWRENLMVQVLDALGNLNLESHSVQSSIVDGKLCLSIESKGCTVATAKSIRQALQRVIGKR